METSVPIVGSWHVNLVLPCFDGGHRFHSVVWSQSSCPQ